MDCFCIYCVLFLSTVWRPTCVKSLLCTTSKKDTPRNVEAANIDLGYKICVMMLLISVQPQLIAKPSSTARTFQEL